MISIKAVEREGTDSIKWRRYGGGVLPLWVADMDFVSPEPVVRALHERVDHRVFGYGGATEEFVEVIRERLKRLYGWDVQGEEIVLVPGVVTGLNLAFTLFAEPGEAVLVQPPVYSHFIADPVNRGRTVIDPPLVKRGDTYDRFRRLRRGDHGPDADLCPVQSPQPRRPGLQKGGARKACRYLPEAGRPYLLDERSTATFCSPATGTYPSPRSAMRWRTAPSPSCRRARRSARRV